MDFTFNDALIAFSEDELRNNAPLAEAAFRTAVQKSGRGNDFLGWAMGNTKEVFGFLLFAFAYLGGAALFSYKYQKTPGFIILGVIGILLTIGSAVLYIINK